MSTYDDKKFGGAFLDQIRDWIAENLKPEEVFSYAQLQEWAEANGFVEG